MDEGWSVMESNLKKLAVEIGDRHVGGTGNNQATEFFYNTMASLGYIMQKDAFDCIEWEHGKVYLKAENVQYEAFVSPYSLPCKAYAKLAVASTLEELKKVDAYQKILLITGELTKEQIMPKNFQFYNPPEHQEIIALLEEKNPKAIICGTGKGEGISGGFYPFWVFEDGDFDIPSVYMKDIDAEKLMKLNGQEIELSIESKRISAKSYNVIARKKGEGKGRIILCAHIDTKGNTPGALDNAGGVSVLMELAKELKDYKLSCDIEIVPFNGEDYYSVPGQMLYLEQNNGDFQDVKMVINIDAAGHRDSKTALSFYNLQEDKANEIMKIAQRYQTIVRGEPWYESDHSMFAMQAVPCIAATSSNIRDVVMDITHTPQDTIEKIDPLLLKELALALRDIVVHLNSLT